MPILEYLLIIFIAAFLGGFLFKKLKAPPVVGYIASGFLLSIFLGEHISPETVNFLAEFGIVLMLFTLGVEFSLEKIKKVLFPVLTGGIIQILGTILVGLLVLIALDFQVFTALFMAGAFALSSTAIVVKLLADKDEMNTLPGEIMIGWLVIQDLAVLPLIVLLPLAEKLLHRTSGASLSIFSLIQPLILAIGLLLLVSILGRKYMTPLMNKVAELNSRELLLVFTFILVGSAAFLTQSLGLSAALGAFLAGILVAKSSQNHMVFSEIRPVRDIFSLVFFTTLGLVLPISFIFNNIGTIVIIAIIFMFIKFILVFGLSLFFGYHVKTSFLVGIGLIEVGEFAFILAKFGLSESLISSDSYSIILGVTLLTIVIMPPLFLLTPNLYTKFREFSKRKLPKVYTKFFIHREHSDTLVDLPLKNHVILCGYGRMGKYIGKALFLAKIPFIVVEYNQRLVDQVKQDGGYAVYGDPGDADILDFAQIETARAVIITIPDSHTQQMVIAQSLRFNKKVNILCRTYHEEQQKFLHTLGADTIIQPEFEGALTMVNKILKQYGEKRESIVTKINHLKKEYRIG